MAQIRCARAAAVSEGPTASSPTRHRRFPFIGGLGGVIDDDLHRAGLTRAVSRPRASPRSCKAMDSTAGALQLDPWPAHRPTPGFWTAMLRTGMLRLAPLPSLARTPRSWRKTRET